MESAIINSVNLFRVYQKRIMQPKVDMKYKAYLRDCERDLKDHRIVYVYNEKVLLYLQTLFDNINIIHNKKEGYWELNIPKPKKVKK